ncbi:hypothetical protein BC834DRAFT_586449 [Gloeopeniophorella convolvens]|nr:hypothetical protein BC834DRAFT_586449 [Gloeopeniophorella convolvens]
MFLCLPGALCVLFKAVLVSRTWLVTNRLRRPASNIHPTPYKSCAPSGRALRIRISDSCHELRLPVVPRDMFVVSRAGSWACKSAAQNTYKRASRCRYSNSPSSCHLSFSYSYNPRQPSLSVIIMATDAGNTIATVYYPKSGDLSVLYRVGQAVLLWPRVSGVKSTDLDTYDTSVKTIQPKDGTTQISDTSNVAAAWSVKGSGKSTRIFVQGTNDYLQETVWDGSDFDKEFKHIHDAADPAPPILVRKNTSIAAVSNQWDTTKKDGDQFDFTIFYQGTDNRIYFIQSPKPGSYTYPLPVTPELATEGTTIQAVQYSDGKSAITWTDTPRTNDISSRPHLRDLQRPQPRSIRPVQVPQADSIQQSCLLQQGHP